MGNHAYYNFCRVHRTLRVTPAMEEPFPAKPKGMHRRTYWRLILETERAQACSWPPFHHKTPICDERDITISAPISGSGINTC